MKIGIISDIHENKHNLIKALEQLVGQGVENILCLGDLMNPGIAGLLAQSPVPVFSVWGNNDGDTIGILNKSHEEGSNLTMADKEYEELELDGKRIFLSHYPDLSETLAHSGSYDVVLHGHTHRQYQNMVGECLLLCPGELSTTVTGLATYAVYDTQSHSAEIIEVEEGVNWNM